MTIKLKLSLSSASAVASSSSTLIPTPPSSGTTVLKISRKGKEKAIESPITPASVDHGVEGKSDKGKVKKEKKEAVKKASPTPSTPVTSNGTGTPVTSSAKKSSKSTKIRPPKLAKTSKRTPSRKQKQTSAIPPHVLSATSTPKGPLTPLPTAYDHPSPLHTSPDPLSGDSVSPVKSEPDDDSPFSQTPYEEDENPFFQRSGTDPTPADSTPVDGQFEASAEPPDTTQLETVAPAPRKLPKKRLRELVTKIIIELRRKDGYALFEDPVDLEAFPDYLDIIGGRDHMMDISTMATKNDDGEYRSMDDVEADLRLLVDSAQKFNPEGTVPHREAAKILSIGLKFMDRYRPQVRTPTPSPGPDDSREVSMFSGREATLGPDGAARQEIPPNEYIPVEMLSFPPNSGGAMAVGWNLTGGKRSHMKKVTRSKEKFYGKWRHWDLDGSRDLAELEDIAEVWSTHRLNSGHPGGVRRVLDFRGMRKEGEWWDWGGLGGVQGLPPLPGTRYPRPPTHKTKVLDAKAWGLYPETDVEVAFIASRTNDSDVGEILAEHLRPMRPRPKKGDWMPPNNFVNVYEGPMGRIERDWLADIATGGTLGEAYTRSISAFLDGAVQGVKDRHDAATADNVDRVCKRIEREYHGGVLQSRLKDYLSSHTRTPSKQRVEDALARIHLRRMFPTNIPLDLEPLLRKPADFMHPGTAGKLGVGPALSQVATYQQRLVAVQRAETQGLSNSKRKRDPDSPEVGDGIATNGTVKKIKIENSNSVSLPGSGASSPLSAAPDSPPPTLPKTAITDATAQILENNRLELIALIKCYPLSALKKMKREVAMQLLPANVWHLMAAPNKT